MRQLFEPAPATAVTPAVSNMAQPECRRVRHSRVSMVRRSPPLRFASPVYRCDNRRMQQSNQRRSHARELRRLPRLLIHRKIRGLDRRTEAKLRIHPRSTLRQRNQVREERVGGKSARNLARRSAAHPVANHIGTGLRRCRAGVFIAMADTAAMGQHGVNKMVRRHS